MHFLIVRCVKAKVSSPAGMMMRVMRQFLMHDGLPKCEAEGMEPTWVVSRPSSIGEKGEADNTEGDTTPPDFPTSPKLVKPITVFKA